MGWREDLGRAKATVYAQQARGSTRRGRIPRWARRDAAVFALLGAGLTPVQVENARRIVATGGRRVAVGFEGEPEVSVELESGHEVSWLCDYVAQCRPGDPIFPSERGRRQLSAHAVRLQVRRWAARSRDRRRSS